MLDRLPQRAISWLIKPHIGVMVTCTECHTETGSEPIDHYARWFRSSGAQSGRSSRKSLILRGIKPMESARHLVARARS